MKRVVEEELKALASLFPPATPLYLVGGRVRDCIVRDMELSQTDADICSAIAYDDFIKLVLTAGLQIESCSEKLGTAWLKGREGRYEYATFRKDSYPVSKGDHLPEKVEFVTELGLDCLRRDFKCNALYYDIASRNVIDPLNGKKDIDEGILSTVRDPNLVFCEDGLRILRLFRFCSTLGFGIQEDTLQGAIRHASNLKDIKSERIAVEIKRLLEGDNAGHAVIGTVESGAMKYVLQRVDESCQIKDGERLSVGIDYTPDRLRVVTLLVNLVENNRGWSSNDNLEEGCKSSAIEQNESGRTGQSSLVKEAEQLASKWKETYPQSMERGLKLVDLTKGVVACKHAEGYEDVKRISVDYAGNIDDILSVLQAMSKDGDKSAMRAYDSQNNWLKTAREREIPLTVKSLAVNGEDIKRCGYRGAEIKAVLERLRDLCVTKEITGAREVLLSKVEEWRRNNG
ncbi:MAG: hypothetical protein ACI4M5_03610 [Christensenellales bacterium]